MDVLVMGGTRFMGLATVRALQERDHRVTVFNRGTRAVSWREPVEEVRGDRDDTESLRPLGARHFDAVVDFSAYTARQTDLLLDVVGDVEHFVHCSTGAVYEPTPTLPWKEDGPRGPWSLWSTYAVEKLAGERVLEKRRTSGSTVVLRLPFVLGPRNYAPREEFVLNRLLDDQEILLPGDGEAVVQMVSLEQVAEVAARAVDWTEPGYSDFNCACSWFVSLRGFVRVAAEVVGKTASVHRVGGGATGIASAAFDAANCVFPFPNASYVLDVRKLTAAGLAPPEPTLYDMLERALAALDPERRRWDRTPAERQAGGLE